MREAPGGGGVERDRHGYRHGQSRHGYRHGQSGQRQKKIQKRKEPKRKRVQKAETAIEGDVRSEGLVSQID